MPTAQHDEVGKRRLAAERPVPYVVRVYPAMRGTSREAAAAVSNAQRSADRRGHAAAAPADAERDATRSVEDAHQVRVAREASRRLGGNRRAALDLTSISLVAREG